MNVKKTLEALKARGWHISFAESCTGGLATATLVSLDGASAVLDGAFVTYANSAKERLVGVESEVLQQFGAVSQEVAAQMAKGCATAMGAQVGVGISGIAGPGGGTPGKPVGTVCFGFYVNGEVKTATCHFPPHSRDSVRGAAVDYVYATLAELLS